MSKTSPSRISRTLLAALLVSACAACRPSGNDGGQAQEDAGGDGARDLSAIHAVLAWERLFEGKNKPREEYRTVIESCRTAGWPVHELGAEEEARLGTGIVEIVIDARRQYVRETSWELGGGDEADPKGMCQAKLVTNTQENTATPDDLDGKFNPIEATAEEELRSAAAAGWQALGDSTLQGQPCKRWRNGTTEVCMWSGGQRWGFSTDPEDMACSGAGLGYLSSIAMEESPLEGDGCKVRLQSFSIGKGLLPSNMPPAIGEPAIGEKKKEG